MNFSFKGYKNNRDINVVNKKTHKETEYDYYVARPNPMGNPFTHKKSKIAKYLTKNRNESIDNYRDWFYERLRKKDDTSFNNEIEKLKDFYSKKGIINLVCWCYPKKCHADIIREFLIKEFNK